MKYLYIFSLFLLSISGFAQNHNLIAKKFDEWAFDYGNKTRINLELKPDTLEYSCKKRLKEGLFVSDKGIELTLECINLYEYFYQKKHIGNTNKCYLRAINFIDSIVPFLYGRDLFRLKLLTTKLVFLSNNLEELKPIYTKNIGTADSLIAQPLDSTILNLTYIKYEIVYRIGDYYFFELNNKEKAEEYYSKILSFDFYKIHNNDEYFDKLRTLYINAGERLIRCRRGNLKKLRYTFFIPSTCGELYPLLKSYIEEMGGKWDRGEIESSLKN